MSELVKLVLVSIVLVGSIVGIFEFTNWGKEKRNLISNGELVVSEKKLAIIKVSEWVRVIGILLASIIVILFILFYIINKNYITQSISSKEIEDGIVKTSFDIVSVKTIEDGFVEVVVEADNEPLVIKTSNIFFVEDNERVDKILIKEEGIKRVVLLDKYGYVVYLKKQTYSAFN